MTSKTTPQSFAQYLCDQQKRGKALLRGRLSKAKKTKLSDDTPPIEGEVQWKSPVVGTICTGFIAAIKGKPR